MSRVRKKRGWMYRGALACVTVLAIGVGAIFVFSMFRYMGIKYSLAPNNGEVLDINHGVLSYVYGLDETHDFEFMYGNHVRHLPRHSELWDFQWRTAPGNGPRIAVPLWFLFVVLATWPAITFIRWFTAKPITGLCPACGYDLRGSKGSATCPECGEVIRVGQ